MPELDKLTYIAAPFFTEVQKEIVGQIEDLLDEKEEPYFSPREYGIIVDDPMNPYRIARIFNMNIRMMIHAFRMVAVTDDFDSGVMFEIGYFYSISDHIITYSPQGYGANVMIAKATRTHCRNIDELELALGGHIIDALEVTE
jgi:nucleoside 2-deoxyribosyltransferase